MPIVSQISQSSQAASVKPFRQQSYMMAVTGESNSESIAITASARNESFDHSQQTAATASFVSQKSTADSPPSLRNSRRDSSVTIRGVDSFRSSMGSAFAFSRRRSSVGLSSVASSVPSSPVVRNSSRFTGIGDVSVLSGGTLPPSRPSFASSFQVERVDGCTVWGKAPASVFSKPGNACDANNDAGPMVSCYYNDPYAATVVVEGDSACDSNIAETPMAMPSRTFGEAHLDVTYQSTPGVTNDASFMSTPSQHSPQFGCFCYLCTAQSQALEATVELPAPPSTPQSSEITCSCCTMLYSSPSLALHSNESTMPVERSASSAESACEKPVARGKKGKKASRKERENRVTPPPDCRAQPAKAREAGKARRLQQLPTDFLNETDYCLRVQESHYGEPAVEVVPDSYHTNPSVAMPPNGYVGPDGFFTTRECECEDSLTHSSNQQANQHHTQCSMEALATARDSFYGAYGHHDDSYSHQSPPPIQQLASAGEVSLEVTVSDLPRIRTRSPENVRQGLVLTLPHDVLPEFRDFYSGRSPDSSFSSSHASPRSTKDGQRCHFARQGWSGQPVAAVLFEVRIGFFAIDSDSIVAAEKSGCDEHRARLSDVGIEEDGNTTTKFHGNYNLGDAVLVPGDRGVDLGVIVALGDSIESIIAHDPYFVKRLEEGGQLLIDRDTIDFEVGLQTRTGLREPKVMRTDYLRSLRRSKRLCDPEQFNKATDVIQLLYNLIAAQTAQAEGHHPGTKFYGMLRPDATILRPATQAEWKFGQSVVDKRRQAIMIRAQELSAGGQTPIELTSGELQLDGRRMTLYYYSDQRVEFKEMVRELFKAYKCRFWMNNMRRGLFIVKNDKPK